MSGGTGSGTDAEAVRLGSDEYWKRTVANAESMRLDNTPWVAPTKPLNESRVAIVTTAGLRPSGARSHEIWDRDDLGFTILPSSDREVVTTHRSNNFDRTGMVADINVIYPIDRLAELADRGTIGSVASNHLSFMGATIDVTLSTLQSDTGPAAAKLLRDDGVDIAILTPACPACARTVNVVAHALEREGIVTLTIASNRDLSERLHPPRALFCDFPFGRPLGKPSDAEFQHGVLEALFGLLAEPEGPVLVDFPESLDQDLDEPIACNLPPADTSGDHPAVAEARGLRSAYKRTVGKLGRTNVGRVVDADDIPELIGRFIKLTEGVPLEECDLTSETLTSASSDIRAYYEEAALALTDHIPEAGQTDTWIYTKTAVGQLLKEALDALRPLDLEFLDWAYLVPLAFQDEDVAPRTPR